MGSSVLKAAAPLVLLLLPLVTLLPPVELGRAAAGGVASVILVRDALHNERDSVAGADARHGLNTGVDTNAGTMACFKIRQKLFSLAEGVWFAARLRRRKAFLE